jgi:hypothetical protein
MDFRAVADRIDADGRTAPDRRSDDELVIGGEARAILGCAEKMLERLRTKPLIASTPGVKGAFPFKRGDLDAFRPRYVFANEMIDAAGLASRMAANQMRTLVMRLGVKPVCARPDFYIVLFERAEVVDALKKEAVHRRLSPQWIMGKRTGRPKGKTRKDRLSEAAE